MGQQGSKSLTDDSTAADDGISLWEGVPVEVKWLVQSQVRLLLANHTSALATRPEQLQSSDEQEDETRAGHLAPHETRLAHAALRDRALAPRLQKALDKLVPSQLNEAQFWDNFFSHVDVIKVRLVTDYLCAQDAAQAERAQKHAEWIRLFDSMDVEMRADVRRAAERIAARQQPPPPSALELQMGLDARQTPRWTVDGESWLEYVEDGPFEVVKVLQAELTRRGVAVETPCEEAPASKDPLMRSPLHEVAAADGAAAPSGVGQSEGEPPQSAPQSEPQGEETLEVL